MFLLRALWRQTLSFYVEIRYTYASLKPSKSTYLTFLSIHGFIRYHSIYPPSAIHNLWASLWRLRGRPSSFVSSIEGFGTKINRILEIFSLYVSMIERFEVLASIIVPPLHTSLQITPPRTWADLYPPYCPKPRSGRQRQRPWLMIYRPPAGCMLREKESGWRSR